MGEEVTGGGRLPVQEPGASYLCLDACFSSAELKRGILQDVTSSPKLDRYKIARQLTEKAIKVNAFGAGGQSLKVFIYFSNLVTQPELTTPRSRVMCYSG